MKAARGLWVLLACQTLLMAGLALCVPFLAIYLSGERGLSPGAVGLFVGLTMLLTAFGQALGGRASDLWGRQPVMVFSLAGRALFTALLGAAIGLRLSVAAVLAAHMTAAFLGGFYNPAAQGWIADHYSSSRRYEAYSWLRVAFNLGFAVGPAIGGFLAAGHFALAFHVSAVLSAACALILRGWVPESRTHRPAAGEGASLPSGRLDPRFLHLCGCTVCIALVMSHLVVPLSIHATRYVGIRPEQVGLLFSLNGFLVVGLQTLVARAMRGRRTTAALAAGSLFYAAGYAMVGGAHSFAGLAAAIAVVTLGEVAVSPGLATLSSNLAPKGEFGRYAGLNGSALMVGAAAGPLAGGMAIQHLSPSQPALPWTLVALAAVAASMGFIALRPRLSRHEEGLEAPMPALPALPSDTAGI